MVSFLRTVLVKLVHVPNYNEVSYLSIELYALRTETIWVLQDLLFWITNFRPAAPLKSSLNWFMLVA